MLIFLLHAFVLCILVGVISQDRETIGYWKLVFISVVVGVIQYLAHKFIGGGALGILSLIPAMAVLVISLMAFASMPLKQAMIVTGLYFLYLIVFAVIVLLIFRPPAEEVGFHPVRGSQVDHL